MDIFCSGLSVVSLFDDNNKEFKVALAQHDKDEEKDLFHFLISKNDSPSSLWESPHSGTSCCSQSVHDDHHPQSEGVVVPTKKKKVQKKKSKSDIAFLSAIGEGDEQYVSAYLNVNKVTAAIDGKLPLLHVIESSLPGVDKIKLMGLISLFYPHSKLGAMQLYNMLILSLSVIQSGYDANSLNSSIQHSSLPELEYLCDLVIEWTHHYPINHLNAGQLYQSVVQLVVRSLENHAVLHAKGFLSLAEKFSNNAKGEPNYVYCKPTLCPDILESSLPTKAKILLCRSYNKYIKTTMHGQQRLKCPYYAAAARVVMQQTPYDLELMNYLLRCMEAESAVDHFIGHFYDDMVPFYKAVVWESINAGKEFICNHMLSRLSQDIVLRKGGISEVALHCIGQTINAGSSYELAFTTLRPYFEFHIHRNYFRKWNSLNRNQSSVFLEYFDKLWTRGHASGVVELLKLEDDQQKGLGADGKLGHAMVWLRWCETNASNASQSTAHSPSDWLENQRCKAVSRTNMFLEDVRLLKIAKEYEVKRRLNLCELIRFRGNQLWRDHTHHHGAPALVPLQRERKRMKISNPAEQSREAIGSPATVPLDHPCSQSILARVPRDIFGIIVSFVEQTFDTTAEVRKLRKERTFLRHGTTCPSCRCFYYSHREYCSCDDSSAPELYSSGYDSASSGERHKHGRI